MPSCNRASRWLALAGAASLAACATDRPTRGGRAVSDMPVKIGAPYRAGGRMWVPADDRGYDAVGYASWYGGAHAGRPTANGERFDPRGISAAHPTLPLPSYVEVTALDSGRTILTRVNDRGPFVASRIIDLSAGAARALGIERQGVARVRVRRVQPPEADRAALRAGRAARARPDAGRWMLAGLLARLDGGTTAARSIAARGGGSGMMAGAGVRGGSAGTTTAVTASAESGATVAAGGAAAAAGGLPGRRAGAAASASPAVVSTGGTEAAIIAAPVDPAVTRWDADAVPAAPSGYAPRPGAAGSPGSGTPAAPAGDVDARPFRSTAADRTAVGAPRPPAVPSSPAGGSPGPFFVAVAALDDADRADGLAGRLAAIGPAAAVAVGPRWQVRLGPYADAGSARSALARVRRAGYQEARIVRDSAQRQEDR